jgi:1,4-alpha-glucan branching enzyme
LQRFVEDLNRLYRAEAALWEGDYDVGGFYWIDCADQHNSVLSFARQNPDRTSELVIIMNLTPVPRYGYRVGLPRPGAWREVLNTDAAIYGGGNVGNYGGVTAEDYYVHNQSYSAMFTLPPLGVVVFQPIR